MLFLSMLFIAIYYCDNYEYVYDINQKQFYLWNSGDRCYKISFNQHGSIVIEEELIDKVKASGRNAFITSGPPYLYSGVRENEKLFEYRSGFLVPMIVDKKLGLIPEVGGKIIDFKDYHYSPTARRIYNLPGRFVLKKEEPAKKP